MLPYVASVVWITPGLFTFLNSLQFEFTLVKSCGFRSGMVLRPGMTMTIKDQQCECVMCELRQMRMKPLHSDSFSSLIRWCFRWKTLRDPLKSFCPQIVLVSPQIVCCFQKFSFFLILKNVPLWGPYSYHVQPSNSQDLTVSHSMSKYNSKHNKGVKYQYNICMCMCINICFIHIIYIYNTNMRRYQNRVNLRLPSCLWKGFLMVGMCTTCTTPVGLWLVTIQ